MRISRTLRRGLLPVAVALAGGVLTTPALAAAPSNGCPVGYQLLSVADLSAQGYQVPAQVDSSTSGILSFGRPGNDDGVVCAVPLGNQQTSFGGQVYNFWDDTLLGS
jgi:hypothetical protein